jgi:hypothetical protein
MMRNIIAADRVERGQSLTELALTLTFILILLAGVVDLGRAFFTFMALRDSAQEGAAYGSINPTDNVGIENRVRYASNMLRDLSDNPNANVTVSMGFSGALCTGNDITVRVEYHNFRFTMPFIGMFIGSQTIPIKATITDTILSPACQ